MPPTHLKRVFVSGEEGSIGSQLVPRLRELGCEILNDQFKKTRVTPYSWADEVDVLGAGFSQALQVLDPTAIIHTAGWVSTVRCEKDPKLAEACNVDTAEVLANAADECYMVHFGTTAIYDPAAPRPYVENSLIKPQTFYGETKWRGELAMRSRGFLDLLVVRPCFVYGGTRDHASVISRMIKAERAQKHLDVELDPLKLKDYLYMSDFLDIVIGLVEPRTTGTYNIAGGYPTPFANVLDTLWSHGVSPEISIIPRKDYMGDHVVDGSPAIRLAGAIPRTSLGKGIALTLESLEKEADYERINR